MKTLPSTPYQNSQRGVALVVVMILLLIMTLLGLASLRGTLMEQRMTSNQLERSYSFQAAEAALREGEALMADPLVRPAFGAVGTGCNNGLCADPVPQAQVLDNSAGGFWIGGGASRAATTPVTAGIQARYIVEFLRNPGLVSGEFIDAEANCTTSGDVSLESACDNHSFRYRVTARATSPSGGDVVLQSNYVAY